MKSPFLVLACVAAGLSPVRAAAQSALFDFENAVPRTPLPISLTVSGIAAQFSGTGQGFSIQPANTMGFTPVGFSGNCIYPSSVYAADLVINFSQPMTTFSILYAPQELGCDFSARMRATASMDGVFVGASTTNASSPGTWPSEILALSTTQAFNRVVVHYDAPPVCQDYGPIFMADNMTVTPAILLANAVTLPDGSFQFAFNHIPGVGFSVMATTNLAAPFNQWSSLGSVPEVAPGQYQFTDLQASNEPRRYYRVSSP